MRDPIRFLFVLLATASLSQAALRCRYTVPRYHSYHDRDTVITGSAHANREFGNESYFEQGIGAGAWEGYSSLYAFDSSSLGRVDSAPFVDAHFWLDSLYEPPLSQAFVANVIELRDSGKQITSDGFIVYLFGGIRFPRAGRWELVAFGDDGGTRIAVDTNNDGRFQPEESPRKRFSREAAEAAPYTPGEISTSLSRYWDRFQVMAVDSVTPDRYYRFFASYYNHSGTSYSGLFWKHERHPLPTTVPASAFGGRRNFGAPAPEVIALTSAGAAIPSHRWPYIRATYGDTVVFTAMLPILPGHKPLLIWDYGDGVVDTLSSLTVSHVYGRGIAVPSVSALWGRRKSSSYGNKIVIVVR